MKLGWVSPNLSKVIRPYSIFTPHPRSSSKRIIRNTAAPIITLRVNDAYQDYTKIKQDLLSRIVQLRPKSTRPVLGPLRAHLPRSRLTYDSDSPCFPSIPHVRRCMWAASRSPDNSTSIVAFLTPIHTALTYALSEPFNRCSFILGMVSSFQRPTQPSPLLSKGRPTVSQGPVP